MTAIDLSETFGPTLQGEGPHAGRWCYFVRLARCDLDCFWCDTPYTWRWKGLFIDTPGRPVFDKAEHLTSTTVDDLCAGAPWMVSGSRVVVTGGEPMIQRRAVEALAGRVVEHGGKVDIETNGRHAPSPDLQALVDLFVVSPKLASSGVAQSKAWRDAPIDTFRCLAHDDRAAFKFVVADQADLVELDRAVDVYDLTPRTVWVMPEGRTPTAVHAGLEWLAPEAIKRGWNLSGRLHVDLWGDERGH